jgi:hypothetical protein
MMRETEGRRASAGSSQSHVTAPPTTRVAGVTPGALKGRAHFAYEALRLLLGAS